MPTEAEWISAATPPADSSPKTVNFGATGAWYSCWVDEAQRWSLTATTPGAAAAAANCGSYTGMLITGWREPS